MYLRRANDAAGTLAAGLSGMQLGQAAREELAVEIAALIGTVMAGLWQRLWRG